MRRREPIVAFGSGVLAWSLVARAQEAEELCAKRFGVCP
jgi:hypothetical protein